MNSTRIITKMTPIKTSATIANRWPSVPSASKAKKKPLIATTSRGFFLPSLAAQWGQTNHLHLSSFSTNGVAMSCSQPGHFAMADTSFHAFAHSAPLLLPRQWNKRMTLARSAALHGHRNRCTSRSCPGLPSPSIAVEDSPDS